VSRNVDEEIYEIKGMERSNSSKKVEEIKIIVKVVRKCGVMYREGSKGVQSEPLSPDF
jgi:hypothetical protein